MGIDGAIHALNLTLGVFFLDLLLSGDNAVVIALACRSLPRRQRGRAMLAGAGAGILLRVVLTSVVSLLLRVPLLKLVGGIALVVIAIKLVVAEERVAPDEADGDPVGASVAEAVGTILIADLVMSVDNVIALAALANGSLWVLVLGLLLSVPLLMVGSWHLTAWLARWPALIQVGGAMLGWFAGDIAVTDPLYVEAVSRQSPALHVVVPMLTAAYVLLQARIIVLARPGAASLRPAARPSREALPQPVRRARMSIDTATPQALAPSPPVALEAALPRDIPSAEPAAAARSSRRGVRWKRLAIAGGGLVALVLLGIPLASTMRNFMPDDLARYDCPSKDVSVAYRLGGARFRIVSGPVSAVGAVDADHQIDWGDMHGVSTRLGFVPPTRLLFVDARSVRIDGGMFADVTCLAH